MNLSLGGIRERVVSLYHLTDIYNFTAREWVKEKKEFFDNDPVTRKQVDQTFYSLISDNEVILYKPSEIINIMYENPRKFTPYQVSEFRENLEKLVKENYLSEAV